MPPLALCLATRVSRARMALEVTEIVVVREAPLHKAWQTAGTPKLVVVGAYRMGIDIEARSGS